MYVPIFWGWNKIDSPSLSNSSSRDAESSWPKSYDKNCDSPSIWSMIQVNPAPEKGASCLVLWSPRAQAVEGDEVCLQGHVGNTGAENASFYRQHNLTESMCRGTHGVSRHISACQGGENQSIRLKADASQQPKLVCPVASYTFIWRQNFPFCPQSWNQMRNTNLDRTLRRKSPKDCEIFVNRVWEFNSAIRYEVRPKITH